MFKSFLYFLEEKQLIPDRDQTTLLAVSGGVDSVVLCHLFKQACLPFAIAHCNFRLRGAASEATTAFVKALATSYEVPFYSTQFDTKTFARNHKVSIQMAARSLRYQFFDRLLQEHGWHKIATAHHWDDAVETILLNFIKGTGIKGFYGIQSMHHHIIRPLLFARKKEIIHYAAQQKLDWEEDSSNQCNHYQRNFVRNKVIPLLRAINPNLASTMQATAIQLKDIGNLFENHLAEIKKKVSTFKEEIHYLDMDPIIDEPWATTVTFELLRTYGFTFKQIQQLLSGTKRSGKTIDSTKYRLHIDRKNWLVSRKKTALPPEQVVVDATRSIAYGKDLLHFRCCSSTHYVLKKTTMMAALDYDRLHFPLVIRPWEPGDFFYPIGMKGRKKISDLLIDLKIPIAIKERVCLVISKGQIVWVIGHRIDERFKLNETTKTVCEIAWAKA